MALHDSWIVMVDVWLSSLDWTLFSAEAKGRAAERVARRSEIEVVKSIVAIS